MNLAVIKKDNSSKILIHSFIWGFFIIASLIQFYENPFGITTDFYAQWITGIFLFYLNYFYLVPQLLLQKKNWAYFGILICLITLFVTVRDKYFVPEFNEMAITKFVPAKSIHPSNTLASPPEMTVSKLLPTRTTHPPGFFAPPPPEIIFSERNNSIALIKMNQPFHLKIVPSFFYIFIIAISVIIKTLTEFYNNQQNKLIAETHRTSTELTYLRKQTNPHFLFNSLNSIYSLAHQKSDLVPDAIVTLSEMMRYMLYETDNKFVFLEKEIDYIKNFIELQKLRLNNIENISINIHGETKDKFIEPLLLISFIENAFKYGTNYKGEAFVKIKIKIEENILDFWVENKVEDYHKDPENSGIGLTNIKSRLNLLYPEAHQLNIVETDSNYSVHLNLKLDETETSIS